MYKLTILLIAGSLSLITTYAYAYIGPGMGGGMIAATVGIVVAIFAALLGVLYYPIKRFLNNCLVVVNLGLNLQILTIL